VGSKVKRVEQYHGACPFCKKIDGMIFEVVDPGAQDKNDWTQMWVGKTNIGRSISPMKRTPDGLVPRTAAEMFRPVPGTQHPHCRGFNVPVSDGYMKDDEFSRWFRKEFDVGL
ncbi:MAG: hypothetical protein IBX56_18940, partial [Methylomicrobium sp.]|nr:hypothetical protein [Methylomicrobium sp.]